MVSVDQLRKRARCARERSSRCDLCPHHCGVDRTAGELGLCGIGDRALVSSWGPHHGEEAPLRGRAGSGTVFFAGCNLACVYCQNYEISHGRIGREVEPDELGRIFLRLQEAGCHNINLVSPSHVAAPILEALACAVDMGLCIPVVYNTGGYDSLETLRLLDGVVDIYMPDMKYGTDAIPDEDDAFDEGHSLHGDSEHDDPEHDDPGQNDPEHHDPEHDDPGQYDPKHHDPEHHDPEHHDPGIRSSAEPIGKSIPQALSAAPDYVDVNRRAVLEMHRQVGDLQLDRQGVALRGLLIRHLVLPGNLAGSESTLRFLAEKVSRNTYLNIMDQYRPCFQAWQHPPLGRRPTRAEFEAVLRTAERMGLRRLD